MRVIKGLTLALLAFCAVPAQAQTSWRASDAVGMTRVGAFDLVWFRGAHRVDLVPLVSLLPFGQHLILRTKTALRGSPPSSGGWVHAPTSMQIVTHSNERVFFGVYDAILHRSNPASKPTQVLSTYYVDDNWTVHKVQTERKRNESLRDFAKRHKEAVKELMRLFPINKENTEAWARSRPRPSNSG